MYQEYKGGIKNKNLNNHGFRENYEQVYRSRAILQYNKSDARPRDFDPYRYASRNPDTSLGRQDQNFDEKNMCGTVKNKYNYSYNSNSGEKDTSSQSYYESGSSFSSLKGSTHTLDSSFQSAKHFNRSEDSSDYDYDRIENGYRIKRLKNSVSFCKSAFITCISYAVGFLLLSLSVFVILIKTGIMDELVQMNESRVDDFLKSSHSPTPTISPSVKPSSVQSTFPSMSPSGYPTYGNGGWSQGSIIQGNELYGMMGRAISLDSSGKYIAVSSGISSPKVTVYRAYYDEWIPMGSLVDTSEYFGSTVKLVKHGTILAVGNMYHNNSIGIVQIFSWVNNSKWVQIGQDLLGNRLDDGFGRSVALSESADKVCIGSAAVQDDASGLVECFILTGNHWTKSVEESGGVMHAISSNDRGLSITSDGSFFAFNAPGVSVYRQDASYVKVFKWANNTGSGTKELVGGIINTPRRPLAVDLALTDDNMSLVLAIGFPELDIDSGTTEPSGPGGVQVYKFDLNDIESTWTEIGPLIRCDTCGINFGRRLSLSNDGKTLAVTSNYAVTLFDWIGSRWFERGYSERRIFQSDTKSVPNVEIAIDSDSEILVAVALSMDEDGYGGNDRGKVKFYNWNS